jgi:hypothetical protein
MPCKIIPTGEGSWAMVCTRGRAPRKPCVACGAPSTRLCDFVVERAPRSQLRLSGVVTHQPLETTCDAALCARCTQRIGRSEDRCPAHRVSQLAPTRQGQLEF